MKKQELYEFLCASQSMAFLDREAREMADAVLKARPEYAPYLSEQALRELRNGCRARLNSLYLNTVSEKIFTAAQAIDPVAAANPDRAEPEVLARADAAAAEAMGADPAAMLREELPLLREYEERIRRYAVEARTEFLDNVFRYRETLSARFFGGREIRRIESLKETGADVHRKGRSVVGVRTDAGTFYYKPHDCRIDALYREIAERFFPDCTAAADCVPGDGCGFVTEIVSAPLESAEELPAYYRNFGMLTALFHGIGTTDMHCENILPCGVRPAAIDLETMLTPKRRRSARRGGVHATAVSETALSLGRTVLRTGVMPAYIHTLGVITPLYPSQMGENYMPYTGGTHYSVRGYEADFLAGFREGYRRVLGHAEEIKALLHAYGDAQLRCLMSNTAYYSNLQTSLYRRKNLASREAQEAVLKQLEVPYRQNGLEPDPAVIAYEAACLLDGDIPYYCVTLDGKALCGASPGEVLHDGFMELSARERTFAFLDRLSEPELTFETGLIRHCLRAVPCAEEDPAKPEKLASQLPERQRVVNMLETVGETIRDRMIPMPDGSALWLSGMPALQTAAGDCGRVTYSADAGRCIAWMKRAGVPDWPEDLAETCLDTVDEAFTLWEREDGAYLRVKLPTDGCFGLAGLLSACDDMAAAGFVRAEDAFRRLTGILINKEFHAAEGPEDLLTALGRSRTEAPGKAALAKRLGERLRETGLSGNPAARTASVGAAFAAACRLTGEDRFAAEAAEALSKVRDRYAERISGWPDENAVLPWLAPRGTQAAWIALLAADARDWLAGRKEQAKAEELLTLSLKSLTAETGLWYNDSLCHGNALAVLALIRASRARHDPKYLERAGFILAAMLDRYDRKGTFTVCPKGIHSFFDISFSCGTTGIGAAAAAWLAETAER